MYKNNITVGSGAKGTSSLVRAKFGPGMLLHHDDLDALNAYTRELSRLMFKSLFGCGVICGLVVEAAPGGGAKIKVGAGVALDCNGDPIYVPRDETLALDDDCDRAIDGQLWVVLYGTVANCAPRTAVCSADDDEPSSVCTRERDGYEIRLVRTKPECGCGCELPSVPAAAQTENACWCVDPKLDCYKDHYGGECGCKCASGSECDCSRVVLAVMAKDPKGVWTFDHRVRRFIRPVLMRDPQVQKEAAAGAHAEGEAQQDAASEDEESKESIAKDVKAMPPVVKGNPPKAAGRQPRTK